MKFICLLAIAGIHWVPKGGSGATKAGQSSIVFHICLVRFLVQPGWKVLFCYQWRFWHSLGWWNGGREAAAKSFGFWVLLVFFMPFAVNAWWFWHQVCQLYLKYSQEGHGFSLPRKHRHNCSTKTIARWKTTCSNFHSSPGTIYVVFSRMTALQGLTVKVGLLGADIDNLREVGCVT